MAPLLAEKNLVRTIKCSRGQATLEAIGAFWILSIAFAGFLALIYVGFVRSFIGYQSDQALFCLAEGQSESHCQNIARREMRKFLPFGELLTFQLTANNNAWRASVDWQWAKFHIKKQRILKADSRTWR